MRVCRRWYDIASPYSFATVPVRHSHGHRFAKHVRTHPGLAEHVRDLYFFDRCWGETGNERHMEIDCCPFDVQLLASAFPFLTNLRKVFIVGYDNKVGPPQRFLRGRQPQRPTATVALQRLTLESCQNVAYILHGLLPLFTIDTLVTDAFLYSLFGQRPPADIETLFPSASVSIQNLALRGTVDHFYEFFERVLAPGCLRGLATGSWWRGDLRLLDRFLQSRAAQNLVSISIGAMQSSYEPRPHLTSPSFAAPGPSVCSVLGAALARCPRLQYVRVGFEQRGDPDEDPLSQSDALVPVLESLPATLRAFALDVWISVFPGYPHGSASSIRSLGPVDRLLDPAGEGKRLRCLRRVELHVYYLYREGAMPNGAEVGEGCRLGDIDQDAMPLPRLLAAGLLREFRVEETEHGPDRTDVYWPSDK
ncbi:hypothetical protein V8D89_005289 [Ganoderma adspersum]